MAYIVAKRGRFEVRESLHTAKGPRSRTLTTFHVFDDQVLDRARDRARRPFDAATLRRAARKAGAPVAESNADSSARVLLG
ncbi:MAG: hypothetical protein ACYDD6_09370, partial [Acidimicrobiales bacterium]